MLKRKLDEIKKAHHPLCSNPLPLDHKACALPLCYNDHLTIGKFHLGLMRRPCHVTSFRGVKNLLFLASFLLAQFSFSHSLLLLPPMHHYYISVPTDLFVMRAVTKKVTDFWSRDAETFLLPRVLPESVRKVKE